MKKIFIVALTSIFTLATSIYPSNAEVCKKIDLSSIFFEEYWAGHKWVESGQNKIITWTVNSKTIKDKTISRKFSQQEEDWIAISLKSWDDAIDSISFSKTNSDDADISIGIVSIEDRNTLGYWTAWARDGIRFKATIELNNLVFQSIDKDSFTDIVKHEIGNALGLGDIDPRINIDSVQKEDEVGKSTSLHLSNDDIIMIRQVYGESTCQNSWKSLYEYHLESIIDNKNKIIIDLEKSNGLISSLNASLSDKIINLENEKAFISKNLEDTINKELENTKKITYLEKLNIKLAEKNKKILKQIKDICKKNKQIKECKV